MLGYLRFGIVQSLKPSNNKKICRLYSVEVGKLFKMFRFRNLLFRAFIINRHWCHYSQTEQQRKYAAVIMGHYFFYCYTQSYYKVQAAWTKGLLCYGTFMLCYLFRYRYI